MSAVAEGNIWVFIILVVILGGGAAFMSGRSLAKDWQPVSHLVLYMLILTAGVRFLNYALFQYDLTSPYYFMVDFSVLLLASLLGYRLKRVDQMVRQYPWRYERSGPLAWVEKQ